MLMEEQDIPSTITPLQGNASWMNRHPLLSPGKNPEPTSLRLNDEIGFYGPIAIHGDPYELRSATVVGVRTYDLEYPLLLSNTTIPLPATHRVRRLPDGYWQPINNYLQPRLWSSTSTESNE